MSRTEFNRYVRADAWERCKGRCELCTAPLFAGKYTFDHRQPDGLGGPATLENCQVICAACDYVKTHKHDRPMMQKADNMKAKHFGIKPKGRPMLGSRASGWKKRMNGETVRR